MHSVFCLADFYNIDLQLKGYNCTCQQIGLQGRAQQPHFIKQRRFKGLRLFPSMTGSFHLFQCWWLPHHILPWTRGYRFCKVSDHANNLPWNCCDTVGWRAGLKAELCSSCLIPGTELLKSFPSFFCCPELTTIITYFLSKILWAHIQGSTAKRSLLRMKWATWTL